jgi:hypothetical protein
MKWKIEHVMDGRQQAFVVRHVNGSFLRLDDDQTYKLISWRDFSQKKPTKFHDRARAIHAAKQWMQQQADEVEWTKQGTETVEVTI